MNVMPRTHSPRLTPCHSCDTALRQSGFSLVELMIAVTLGLLLLAGVGHIFLGSKQTYRMQEGMSRVQENGRFALGFLSRDIRMAGYVGCSKNVGTINNTLNGPPPSFDPARGIQGWEYTGTGPGATYGLNAGAAPVSTTGGAWLTAGGNVLDDFKALPGSDIVRIWTSGPDGPATIVNPGGITPGANTTVRVVPPTIPFADDEILLLSDCSSADIVQACTVQSVNGGTEMQFTLSQGCNPGNIAALTLGTQAGGEVVRLVSYIYYIGKRGDIAANPPALMRRPLNYDGAVAGAPEELIEGVESMQILYGEDTNGDGSADRQVAANQVADWTRVVSTRAALLVRGEEQTNSTADTATYDLAGTLIDPVDDRRHRRVFATTIQLRNRAS